MNIPWVIAVGLVAGTLSSCSSLRRSVKPSLGPATWTAADGKQMPWRASRVPRGTKERCVIVTVHGLGGAAWDFHLLAERLPALGITVYGYELRGQGNDPDLGRRGDIDDSETWLRDLMTFHRLVNERHPGAPIIWYGESLGSLIALHAAARHCPQATPDALILASPMGGVRKRTGLVGRRLFRLASHILPACRLRLGTLAGVDESRIRVTSTTTRGGQIASTPHYVPAFTLRLLRKVDDLLQKNRAAAERLDIPVLMLGSPHDVVSSPEQVEALFGQIRSDDKRLLWYLRSHHLLLHDVQHDEVIRDVVRWVRARG